MYQNTWVAQFFDVRCWYQVWACMWWRSRRRRVSSVLAWGMPSWWNRCVISNPYPLSFCRISSIRRGQTDWWRVLPDLLPRWSQECPISSPAVWSYFPLWMRSQSGLIILELFACLTTDWKEMVLGAHFIWIFEMYDLQIRYSKEDPQRCPWTDWGIICGREAQGNGIFEFPPSFCSHCKDWNFST